MKPLNKTYVSDFPTVDSFYEFARVNGVFVDENTGIIYVSAGRGPFGDLKFKVIGMVDNFSDPHYMFQFMLDAIKIRDRNMTKRIWRMVYLSRHLKYGK